MWRLDPRKTALLVIDMQNDFVLSGHPMEVPMARHKLPQIQGVMEDCRTAGIPVIYTEHVLLDAFDVSPLESTYNVALRTAGLRKGTPGARVVDDLKPAKDEIVIQKHRYDAFHNTELDTILKTIRGLHQIDTVIITGTLTEVCCESTARSAFMRDYKVVLVSDATGALSEEAQAASEKNISSFFGRVLSSRDLAEEIRTSGQEPQA